MIDKKKKKWIVLVKQFNSIIHVHNALNTNIGKVTCTSLFICNWLANIHLYVEQTEI